MDYITAVHQAIARLRDPAVDPDVEIQAALRLACRALEKSNDRTWAPLSIDLLTVLDGLYPHPEPITLHTAAPTTLHPALRTAVTELVHAVAHAIDSASARQANRQADFADAAARLRTTVRGLP